MMNASICQFKSAISAGILALLFSTANAETSENAINPAVDYDGFFQMSLETNAYRARRRVSEAEFIAMANDPDTIILDTRSAAKFAQLHIDGAINLVFSDITEDTLRSAINSPSTRVLIYCNNNFTGPIGPFPRKIMVAALNIPTFITLYSYGYRNIYELGPLIDPADSMLSFAGSMAQELAN